MERCSAASRKHGRYSKRTIEANKRLDEYADEVCSRMEKLMAFLAGGDPPPLVRDW